MLAQAAREYNQGSVLFLGVAFDGSREDMLTVLHCYGIASAWGQSSTKAIAVTYGLLAIPVTVVVDR